MPTTISRKRVTRIKKTALVAAVPSPASFSPSVPADSLESLFQVLSNLILKIEQAKTEIANLQKKIVETQETWQKEQTDHDKAISERNQEEETARERAEEEYQYQLKMRHKKAEDEFLEKKSQWEKELAEGKERIETDRQELVDLRAKLAAFESELAKAIKETEIALEKQLRAEFATETKIREQEIKNEKEILGLKISSLTAETTRQAAEIENLKKSLDEATRQIKEIAVKVIESSGLNASSPTLES